MKYISFNINGIRARLHQIEEVVKKHQPAVIGLQEIKVVDEQFPTVAIESLGYHVAFHGQKSHYGVALMTKDKPKRVIKGFPGDAEDAQRRFIGCELELPNGRSLHVFNGYFPQGESRTHPEKFPAKQKFYADLLAYLSSEFSSDDEILVMGDMNVAPYDVDIGIGDDNAKRWLRSGKCSFLPEEREWFHDLCDWGLVDTYRTLHPDNATCLSWFDYRSKGFEREPRRGLRIDFLLATSTLFAHCRGAGVDYDIRAMERPSDHCPVWAEFE